LLDEQGVVTLVGNAFGAPPQDLSLRLATSLLSSGSPATVEAALAVNAPAASPAQFVQEHCQEVYEVGRRFRRFIESLEKLPLSWPTSQKGGPGR
jgi:hypothetical protein